MQDRERETIQPCFLTLFRFGLGVHAAHEGVTLPGANRIGSIQCVVLYSTWQIISP